MMTLRHINPITLALCCILTLHGCSREEDAAPESKSMAIGFSASTDWADVSSKSRAAIITENKVSTFNEDTDTEDDRIGVTAVYVRNNQADLDLNTSVPHFYMFNQEVKEEGNSWWYSPIKYWPETSVGKLRFFAYWPYDDEEGRVRTSVKTEQGFKLHYNAPKADLDVLGLSTGLIDQVPTNGEQEIKLKHLLTKLNFSFRREKDDGDTQFHPLVYMLRFPIPVSGTYDFVTEKWGIPEGQHTIVTRYTQAQGEPIPEDASDDGFHTIEEFTCYVLPHKLTNFEILIDNEIIPVDLSSSPINLQANQMITLKFTLKNLGANRFIATFTLWEQEKTIIKGELK